MQAHVAPPFPFFPGAESKGQRCGESGRLLRTMTKRSVAGGGAVTVPARNSSCGPKGAVIRRLVKSSLLTTDLHCNLPSCRKPPRLEHTQTEIMASVFRCSERAGCFFSLLLSLHFALKQVGFVCEGDARRGPQGQFDSRGENGGVKNGLGLFEQCQSRLASR